MRIELQSKQTECNISLYLEKCIKYIRGSEGYEPGTVIEEKNAE